MTAKATAPALKDGETQAEWPWLTAPVGTPVVGHCSTCTVGRPNDDASVIRIDHLSALADGRFMCFCDRCLTVIASFAPKVAK